MNILETFQRAIMKILFSHFPSVAVSPRSYPESLEPETLSTNEFGLLERAD